MIALSQQQDAACAAVLDWFTLQHEQVFRLFGYAGTGKTSIAKILAQAIREKSGKAVVFAAFTGKAASVLRDKGCHGASTIHSLIYKPVQVGSKVTFMLAGEDLRSKRVAMVIIDECSMVGEELGRDLESFRVPILVLGDPAQLPPVGGGGHFTNHEPHVLLTEIHRQKEGCGILDIATAVRMGQPLPLGTYSESAIRPLSDLHRIDPFEFDQVIVGKNATRRSWNAKMRARLGRTSALPVPGDRLICLRNNRSAGIMNGEQVTVVEAKEGPDGNLHVTFDHDGDVKSRWVSTHYLLGNEGDAPWSGDELLFFDYGYAITCHKSQGSQFRRVLVIDESRVFRESAARWLYTATTRASEHVTVVR